MNFSLIFFRAFFPCFACDSRVLSASLSFEFSTFYSVFSLWSLCLIFSASTALFLKLIISRKFFSFTAATASSLMWRLRLSFSAFTLSSLVSSSSIFISSSPRVVLSGETVEDDPDVEGFAELGGFLTVVCTWSMAFALLSSLDRNTSVAAKGALAHHLQRRTARKIQNDRQRTQK